jgi:hypothetical protein
MTADPPPDYGFTPCALTDGGIPPWSPDMSGRLVTRYDFTVPTDGMYRVSIPLTFDQYNKMMSDGSALVSFETPNNEVQAFYVPLASTSGSSG